jgi:hypothetical protein
VDFALVMKTLLTEEFYESFGLGEEAKALRSDSAELTQEEKQELKEMGVSMTLREEFRALRRNSRTEETNISVDDLIGWLTTMATICPQPATPRPFVHYTHAKI